MMPRFATVTLRKRVIVLMAAFFIAAIGLLARVAYLQLFSSQFYLGKSMEQRLQLVPVSGRRGRIYDRNGKLIAGNISAATVYAIPAEVQEPEETARFLAKVLDEDYEFLYKRLTKRSAVEWLAKRISDEQVAEILAADLPGVGIVDNPVRYYPHGDLAAHILGIVGIDDQGLEGIELHYDEQLRGKLGRVYIERDAKGRKIPHGQSGYVPPVDGYDLVLNIDRVIQEAAQKEIRQVVSQQGAKNGTIIVMDPNTGEILAVAVYPTFEPEDYQSYPVENRRNIAFTDTYEPGSTFKIVTTSAALEEGLADLNRSFFDPGYIMVSGWRVRCHRRGGHGPQNFVEALQNSCNVVFAKLALELGDKRFYEYIKRFGYGSQLGVDFPGEAPGKVRAPSDDIPLVTWSNIGFGQGLTITALQILSSACTIANGGKLMRPYLVGEIRRPDGSIYQRIEPTVIRRVISEESAAKAAYMMHQVVVAGSGKRAQVKGIEVCGKTGTAQIAIGGRYSHSRMVASFVGFAPLKNPRVAAAVVVREPTGQYGGVVCAPAFGRLMSQILPYLGVEPTRDKSKQDPDVQVPDVRGLVTDQATAVLQDRGLKVELFGSGGQVLDQAPVPGAAVPMGSTVLIYTPWEDPVVEEVEPALGSGVLLEPGL